MKSNYKQWLWLLPVSLSLSVQAQRFVCDFEEPTDPTHYSVEKWKNFDGVEAAWGSTAVRYAKHIPPALPVQKVCRLTGWKGERVNAQAVMWCGRPVENLTFRMGDFKKGDDLLPSEAFTAAFVRYVLTDEYAGGCGLRPDASEYDSSLVADMIDHITSKLSLAVHSVQGIWVKCRIPESVPAGCYKGNLQLFEGENRIALLPMEIKVIDRTLPSPADWAFHLDLWQNPFAVARIYNLPLWSKAHFDAMRPVMTLLADAGQKVITASIMHRPWNAQTYDAFESMVSWTREPDGRWSFDFTVFDLWVEFMMSLGIDEQINCYSMVPWKLSFLYFDRAANRMQEWKAAPGDTTYSEVWGAMLREFATHLRKKGWFRKTAIAMDERSMQVMLQAMELVESAAPGMKISLAGNYHAPLGASLYDYCIAVEQHFPDSVLACRKAAGRPSTFYTCCAQPHPNTFTFSSPDDALWIGPYCAARGLDGYLRWSYNSWTEQPLTDSRFTAFPAGDTYIVYPDGRTSVRFEKLVEGIQAFEKIRLLRTEYEAKGNKREERALKRALSKLDLKNFEEKTSARYTQEIIRLLNR